MTASGLNQALLSLHCSSLWLILAAKLHCASSVYRNESKGMHKSQEMHCPIPFELLSMR